MAEVRRTGKKILLFVLLVSLVAAGIVEPYFQNEVYHYQDGGVRDSLAGTLDVLVCGSSHAYRGIVPEVLDETLGCRAYNLSTTRMTLAGQYELLKAELARNPVELVILEVSFDSMTRDRTQEGPEGDIYQLGRYRNPLTRLSYFFRHIRVNEYLSVFYDTLYRGVEAWKALAAGTGETENPGDHARFRIDGLLYSIYQDENGQQYVKSGDGSETDAANGGTAQKRNPCPASGFGVQQQCTPQTPFLQIFTIVVGRRFGPRLNPCLLFRRRPVVEIAIQKLSVHSSWSLRRSFPEGVRSNNTPARKIPNGKERLSQKKNQKSQQIVFQPDPQHLEDTGDMELDGFRGNFQSRSDLGIAQMLETAHFENPTALCGQFVERFADDLPNLGGEERLHGKILQRSDPEIEFATGLPHHFVRHLRTDTLRTQVIERLVADRGKQIGRHIGIGRQGIAPLPIIDHRIDEQILRDNGIPHE